MDLEAIFSVLHSYRVKYVLVGALGAIAHGAKLETHDVDICHAIDAVNLRRTAAALQEMRAYPAREPAGRPISSICLSDWKTLRLDDPSEHHLFTTLFGDIDLLPQPFGRGGWGSTTDYAQLVRHAVKVEAFGLTIPVADFNDIKSSKLALGRKQDLAGEAELARIGSLLAQGILPDFGLEQFSSEQSESGSLTGPPDIDPTNLDNSYG
jgi:hypothetical protein